MKTRNAPISILVAAALITVGAAFNFVLGLVFSLAPEKLKAIEVTRTPGGAPLQSLIVAGIACIAFGFVYLWVFKEIFSKSHFAVVMIYTISTINIIFGLFRWPLGLIFIAVNLFVVFLVRSDSAREWLSTPS